MRLKNSWGCLSITTFFVFSSSISCFGLVGKLEAVHNTVKLQCHIDLNQQESLKLVKSLFLACVPGTTIEVRKECRIKCLKENAGVILGQ